MIITNLSITASDTEVRIRKFDDSTACILFSSNKPPYTDVYLHFRSIEEVKEIIDRLKEAVESHES